MLFFHILCCLCDVFAILVCQKSFLSSIANGLIAAFRTYLEEESYDVRISRCSHDFVGRNLTVSIPSDFLFDKLASTTPLL